MPRTTRTHGTKKNDDRRMNDATKMHGAHANEGDRSTRQGRNAHAATPPRKSDGRFTGDKRGR